MDRTTLINKLNKLVKKSIIYGDKPFSVSGDPSNWHKEADELILQYLNDHEISDLFDKIEKWYD